jgi:diacylglycerol kinase (ATP)
MTRKFWDAFNNAFNGIMYATRTQPNMRVHLTVALLVLIAALMLRLERDYVVGLIVIVALVLGLELVNTSVETVVDMLTDEHHPLAKAAKDTAAGAVLVASIAAIIVGYLVFYQGIINGGQRVFTAVASVPTNIAFVGLAVVAIFTVFAKSWTGRGTALRGGAISGHAALAFAAATLLAFFYQRPLAALLGYFVAFLAAQARVEAKIHTPGEATAGGLLGTVAALAIYLLARIQLGHP